MWPVSVCTERCENRRHRTNQLHTTPTACINLTMLISAQYNSKQQLQMLLRFGPCWMVSVVLNSCQISDVVGKVNFSH